jgi:hypothetical protein
MTDQYTKMELKAIAKFLSKVYPGMTDQDELWNLINKTQQLIKGKPDARSTRRRGDTDKST